MLVSEFGKLYQRLAAWFQYLDRHVRLKQPALEGDGQVNAFKKHCPEVGKPLSVAGHHGIEIGDRICSEKKNPNIPPLETVASEIPCDAARALGLQPIDG